ncbi:hypothetical protein CFP56_026670 [Quercus suber]|uniref:Uncharacterized protein n=1 Tax=Quercus suber TaxID=58331 RepID=A0AAW0JZL6_QUESU
MVENCHGDRNRCTVLFRNDLTEQQLICQGDDEIEYRYNRFLRDLATELSRTMTHIQSYTKLLWQVAAVNRNPCMRNFNIKFWQTEVTTKCSALVATRTRVFRTGTSGPPSPEPPNLNQKLPTLFIFTSSAFPNKTLGI